MKNKLVILSIKFKIKWKHRKLFSLYKKLNILGERIISKINWDSSEFHFLTVCMLSQNIHRIKTIKLILESGLSSDAWPIFRGQIENTLDYDYINKNQDKLDMYFKYSIRLDLHRIERRLRISKLNDDEKSVYNELKNAWDKYAYLFKDNSGRVRNSWRDKSLEDIAKEANMEEIYYLTYREANDYTHANSNLIQYYIKGKNREGLMMKIGPTYEKYDIDILLPTSQLLFLHILMLAEGAFQLGMRKELKSMENLIRKESL